ncbi:UNVERIFIED_CONTAM: hypothetical protein HDU68_011099 [Siphonaria sp. JEL0065]|nr:hypothetical protein HDU68_011099 [Siphonaria sp. JEL0065]
MAQITQIATLQIDNDESDYNTTSSSRVAYLANDLLSKSSTLVNGSFMDLDDLEGDDVEVIDLSPSQLQQSLPFRLSLQQNQYQTSKRNVAVVMDKSSSFTSQVRFSPLSSHTDLKQIAQTLMTLLKKLPLDPWEYADLVTDIDTAVHLHSGKDAYWARDVLMIGVSLAKAALLSLKRRIPQKQSFDSQDPVMGETAVEVNKDTKQRIKDTLDFFRVIVSVGEQSCYRARKLIKCLQGGWYVHGVSMDDLAERVCVEDRWWKKIQGK